MEFNGGMSPTDYGDEALTGLSLVADSEAFERWVEEFNATHHQYPDIPLVAHVPTHVLDDRADFTCDYFSLDATLVWFSDWVFIRNATTRPIVFRLRDHRGSFYSLLPGAVVRFYFGAIAPEDRRKFLVDGATLGDGKKI